MRKFLKSITLFEWIIWSLGIVCCTLSFIVFKNRNYHYLAGALIGLTSVLLVAKGNLIGQCLIIVFSLFYGIISYSYAYYGEMITYLGMSLPMAAAALVSWIRNPYKNGVNEVKVNRLSVKEMCVFSVCTVAVTVAFYFILEALDTANLIVSTISVATSFAAAYLTVRRSRFYAVGYPLNDFVLIALWCLASAKDIMYLPMVVCFVMFAVFDIYGFVNWSRMSKRQSSALPASGEEQPNTDLKE